MSLPMHLDEVTVDWLESAFSAGGHPVKINSVEKLTVLHGGATKVRMKIDYADNGSDLPDIVWLKTGFEADQDFVEGVMKAQSREAKVFRDILPLYDIRTVKSFFAGFQDTPSQGAVILEDLSDARFHVATQPLKPAEVASGLETLARQHSQSWDDPRLADFDILPTPFKGSVAGTSMRFYEEADELFKCPRGYSVPMVLHDKERFGAGIKAYAEHAAQGPICFLHGDAHVGNSYTDRDGSVRFLDWQVSKKGHWSHDLGYFITTALDVPDRRSAERELIQHYLEHLRINGTDAPSFDEAWTAYRKSLFYPFFIWLGNEDAWQLPEINLVCFARAGYAMMDHDVYGLLGV